MIKGGLGIKWLNFYCLIHTSIDLCLSSWKFDSTVWGVCLRHPSISCCVRAPPIIFWVFSHDLKGFFEVSLHFLPCSLSFNHHLVSFWVLHTFLRFYSRDPNVSHFVHAPSISLWDVFNFYSHSSKFV